MTLTTHEKVYRDLLINFKPRPIDSTQEHQRILTEVEELMAIAKTSISKNQAKALANLFNEDVGLFL
jgi:hypothetical protein